MAGPDATDPTPPWVRDAAERLLAIEDIKRLKARYFRLLDAQDWEAWRGCFTEDLKADVRADAGPDGLLVGREAWVGFVQQSLSGGMSIHHGHMPEIELVDLDRATGVWAMQDHVAIPVDETSAFVVEGRGHYHETYRRGVDGQWRIASLRLTRQHVTSGVQPVTPPSGR